MTKFVTLSLYLFILPIILFTVSLVYIRGAFAERIKIGGEVRIH